jgi:hypothetical protein
MHAENGCIDPANPGADTTPLGHVIDPLTPDYHWWLFRRGDRLIFRTRRTSTQSDGQREVPIAAARWIHDSITLGFWCKPEDGGFAAQTHSAVTTFATERLELRRGWGIGGPGEPGFTVTNFARLGVLGTPEELLLSDELLIRGGLLALLAAIVP